MWRRLTLAGEAPRVFGECEWQLESSDWRRRSQLKIQTTRREAESNKRQRRRGARKLVGEILGKKTSNILRKYNPPISRKKKRFNAHAAKTPSNTIAAGFCVTSTRRPILIDARQIWPSSENARRGRHRRPRKFTRSHLRPPPAASVVRRRLEPSARFKPTTSRASFTSPPPSPPLSPSPPPPPPSCSAVANRDQRQRPTRRRRLRRRRRQVGRAADRCIQSAKRTNSGRPAACEDTRSKRASDDVARASHARTRARVCKHWPARRAPSPSPSKEQRAAVAAGSRRPNELIRSPSGVAESSESGDGPKLEQASERRRARAFASR